MSNTLQPPSKVTVVEEGTEFQGTLTSSCPIDVRGRVEGELRTPALTVSATGAVHGRAKVGEVRSQGEISGEFDADKIELAGVVRDKTIIRARSLDVKIGAQRGKLQIVFGECELSIGDEPTEHDYENAQAAAAPAPVVSEAIPAAALPAEAAMAAEAPSAAAPSAEATPLVAPEPSASPEAAAVVAALPEAPAAEAEAKESEDEADDAAEVMTGGATGGKRKRRNKNGHDEATAGWSQPPSQPPPAN